MIWASAISREASLEAACTEATTSIADRLGDRTPDLGIVFCTPAHREASHELVDRLATTFPTTRWVGCSAGGVIGGGRETMGGHGISVVAASLPGVRVTPFHLPADGLPMPGDSPGSWRRRLGVDRGPGSAVLVLPDPFSCEIQRLLAGFDAMLPAGITAGGLVSGGEEPGAHLLFHDSEILHDGVVGVGLAGNLVMETIVAQGCRPIANPMFITATADPFITELDGRRPLEVLEEIFESLSEPERELFRFSLSLGLVMRSDQVKYRHGDFLIRNLAGVEPSSGAIAVAAPVEVGQVVQFHVRDRRASAEDLRVHLESYASRRASAPHGGLLFSCLGRGELFYGEPDHDSIAFRELVGPAPLAGFFCNGEIGPVRGSTYLHGYTSIFALFRPA